MILVKTNSKIIASELYKIYISRYFIQHAYYVIALLFSIN